MAAGFRAAFGRQRPLLVAGGPRFGPRFGPSAAHDLGVDKIFGRGTTPREVASHLVHALAPEGKTHSSPTHFRPWPPLQPP